MAGLMGFDPDKYTLYKPRLRDFYVVGNPDVPQVSAPQPFSVVPHNNPYQSVINAQTRLLASGQPIPQPDKPGFGTLLFKALDVLDRPRNALFTGIRHATDNDPGTGFLSGAWKGLKGEVKTYGSDFIPETVPKPARAIGGFLLDVVGDPLTYLTGGAAKLGQTALVGSKAASVAPKLRAALGLADNVHVTPEMVSGLIGKAESAVSGAKVGVSEASRAATQSRKYYFPGLLKSEFDPSVVGKLDEFVKSKSLREAAIDPDLSRKLFEKFGVTGSLDREALLKAQFGEKSRRIKAFLKDAEGTTDLQFLDRLDSTGRRLASLDSVYTSLESRLPPEIAKLNPRQKALSMQLFDFFGPDSGLDVFTAAQHIEGTIPKRKLSVGAGLTKLSENFDALGKAKGALTAAENEVQLTKELSAQFQKETGRYFLKYMGQPIVDISPVKNFVAEKVVLPAYNKIPLVKGIMDTWGMLFLPHYIKYSEKFKETIGPGLVEFEKLLTRTLQREHSIPHIVARDAAETLGQDFASNPKLNKALGYYIEANMAEKLLPDLERAIEAGTKGSKLDYEAAMEAISYWGELSKQFSPEELAALKRGSLAYSEKAKALYAIDEMIGREYDPIEDYFHHVYKQDDKVVQEHLRAVLPQPERIRKHLSTGLEGADKERRFLTLAYAKKIGLEPLEDAITSLAVRDFKTSMARYHWELAEKLLEIPGIVSDRKHTGFVSLGREIPKLTGRYVHPEVARHLKRVDYLFYTDAGYEELMRHIAKVTNLVKAAQVGYNPNFTVRNAIGEGLMNVIAGVGIPAHETAFKALRGADDAIRVAEGQATIQALVKDFQDDGLWFAGVTKGNLAESLQERVMDEARVMQGGKRQQINVLGQTKLGGVPVTLNPNVLRETSDWFDRWYRLAHYIDRRMKGFGREAAATDVRKFHVDYQDLTPAEKHVFRTVVPYYTYFRKNLPIQLRLLVEQPGHQTAIAKLVNNASHALGDPELSKYATENLALPLYEKEDGDVVVLNWNLPIVDLGRVHFDLRSNLQEQLGSLTPLVRVPFEIATNRTLSVDRPIERYAGEKTPLFEHLQGSPQLSAKLKYALEQFGGSLVNMPASSVGRFTGYEREIPDRPSQVPFFQSLLPVQRPSTATQASLYRYRDKLLAAIQAAEAGGEEIISIRDLR